MYLNINEFVSLQEILCAKLSVEICNSAKGLIKY